MTLNKSQTYDREKILSSKINQFISQKFDLPLTDFYSKFSIKDLLDLKSALSDINNILTLRLTKAFISWVALELKLTNEQKEILTLKVTEAKPNSNGYDVFNESFGIPFIAEIKCNIPINGGNIFGSAQKNGLMKDIGHLWNGKIKAQKNTEKFLKILVLPDLIETRNATAHLIQSHKDPLIQKVKICNDKNFLPDTNVIFIKYIKI